MRSLRSLVNSSRTYTNRLRSHARRPVVSIPEYLTIPPPPELDMMDDEEEEFEMNMPPVEGARLPSDLHDAYSGSRIPSWSFSAVTTRRGLTSSPTPSDEWQPPPSGSPSNPTLPRPWPNTVTAPPTLAQGTLSRQPSVRRATRIRVDFNESSQRRRWSARDPSAVSPRPDVAESVTEPRDGLVWNRPLHTTSRRFFPLHRSARRQDSWSATWPDNREGGPSPDAEAPSDPVPTTSWTETTFIDPSSPDWTFNHRPDPDSRAMFRIPRLRRGGVIPPESMISRRASPVIVTSAENAGADGSSTSAAVATPVVVFTPPPLDPVAGETPSVVLPVSPPRPPLPSFAGETLGYPTPG
jgi:hypothetical protein